MNIIEIPIEPLRNRPEDVPHLIDYYIKDYSKRFNGQNHLKISPKNLKKMMSYNWPGNVRELQNVLKRIMILGEDEWDFGNMVVKIDNNRHDKEDRSSPTDSLVPDNLLNLNEYNAAYLKNLSLKEINKIKGLNIEPKDAGQRKTPATGMLAVVFNGASIPMVSIIRCACKRECWSNMRIAG